MPKRLCDNGGHEKLLEKMPNGHLHALKSLEDMAYIGKSTVRVKRRGEQ